MARGRRLCGRKPEYPEKTWPMWSIASSWQPNLPTYNIGNWTRIALVRNGCYTRPPNISV